MSQARVLTPEFLRDLRRASMMSSSSQRCTRGNTRGSRCWRIWRSPIVRAVERSVELTPAESRLLIFFATVSRSRRGLLTIIRTRARRLGTQTRDKARRRIDRCQARRLGLAGLLARLVEASRGHNGADPLGLSNV